MFLIGNGVNAQRGAIGENELPSGTVSGENDAKELGERLREARGDLSLDLLASLSGVSKAEISRLENGRRQSPGTKNIKKLAKALRVSAAWLMTGHQEPTTEQRSGEAASRARPKNLAHALLQGGYSPATRNMALAYVDSPDGRDMSVEEWRKFLDVIEEQNRARKPPADPFPARAEALERVHGRASHEAIQLVYTYPPYQDAKVFGDKSADFWEAEFMNWTDKLLAERLSSGATRRAEAIRIKRERDRLPPPAPIVKPGVKKRGA